MCAGLKKRPNDQTPEYINNSDVQSRKTRFSNSSCPYVKNLVEGGRSVTVRTIKNRKNNI